MRWLLRHVRNVPIVLKKSFLTGAGNFSEPLKRFVRRDVRDHVVTHKNDHGPSYQRQKSLQRWRRRKIIFREILGVVRFSTFATISARFGLMHRSKQLKLLDHFVGAGEQKCGIVISLNWPA